MKIILATGNLHKIREFKAMLRSGGNFDIYSLRDFPDYVAPKESALTFEGNATKKALAATHLCDGNTLILADDSGLVVPALQGEPGVYSARYAGEDATDKDNRKKLIAQLQLLDEQRRSGYFECCLCLADATGIIKTAKGFCEGTLLTEERGGNGFGYDPLFVKYDYSKTLAELDETTKNKISHRRKAFDKIASYLEDLPCATS